MRKQCEEMFDQIDNLLPVKRLDYVDLSECSFEQLVAVHSWCENALGYCIAIERMTEIRESDEFLHSLLPAYL
jgi:hypothetical protein